MQRQLAWTEPGCPAGNESPTMTMFPSARSQTGHIRRSPAASHRFAHSRNAGSDLMAIERSAFSAFAGSVLAIVTSRGSIFSNSALPTSRSSRPSARIWTNRLAIALARRTSLGRAIIGNPAGAIAALSTELSSACSRCIATLLVTCLDARICAANRSRSWRTRATLALLPASLTVLRRATSNAASSTNICWSVSSRSLCARGSRFGIVV